MENYSITITDTINEERLQKGVFIFMYRVLRIPPHLGLIVNGELYDITLHGPNLGISAVDFYRTMLKRKSELVLIELVNPEKVITEASLKEVMKKYWKVSSEVSCLFPVRDILATAYACPDLLQAEFFFDLLPRLKDEGLIKSTSQINLFNKLNNNALELIKYSKKDIENCVHALQRKEQQAC
ncbi:MAG: hypothetical protein KDD41_09680 [Flavobacteriales bacterium]|nr:hypothetical protein [Flavobacteriales bacterium]